MTFLYPSMLWALTALAIPIAVHLFNLRKHKLVYFSNTAVLKTIQQENAKTKKLKRLVTLMLRCLFVAALVLAFAFPFKKETVATMDTEEGLVGIFLDNSMSMKAQSSKTTLLEDARESARNLVASLPPSTRYLLMTNSFEIQNEYPMNQEEMVAQLDRMKLDGPPVKMDAMLERFGMLRKLHGFDHATLFVYSDFQRTMFDVQGLAPDSTFQLVVVPLRAEVDANLSIDSVWFGSPVMQPGLANEVVVLLTNHGDKEVKGLPLNLTMDGRVVASATADLEGGGSAEVVMQFLLQERGAVRCAVSITDYPITFDDNYRFVIETHPAMKVVELGGDKGPSCLSMIFSDDPQFDFERIHPMQLDLSELSKAQLIVVDATSTINATMRQAILDNASEGASVAFFHDDGNTIDTNAVAVDGLSVQHDFFKDLILDLPQHADLPRVSQHVRLVPQVNTTILATLANGDPFLMERSVGRGRVYDIATMLDAEWSNLADNALVVPMMLKMALLGGGVERPAYTLGLDKTLAFGDIDATGDLEIKVRSTDAAFESMPAHEVRNNKVYVFLQDDLPGAGYYELLANDSVTHLTAWNDSRSESEMRFVEPDDVKAGCQAAGLHVMAVVKPEEFAGQSLAHALARKSSLWRWFALLALLALLGEVAVLRFWK